MPNPNHKPKGPGGGQFTTAARTGAGLFDASQWTKIEGIRDDHNDWGLSPMRNEEIPVELVVMDGSLMAKFFNATKDEARYSIEQIAIQNGLIKPTSYEFRVGPDDDGVDALFVTAN